VLWSVKSAASAWVLDEAQRAMSRRKLVPVKIAGFTDYPLGFGQLHAHDLQDWDGSPEAAAFQPVIAAVERLTGRKREVRGQPPPQAPSAPEVEREIAFWRGVSESREPADLQAYLDRFGETALFGELARRRLTALQRAPVHEAHPTAPSEAAGAVPSPVERAAALRPDQGAVVTAVCFAAPAALMPLISLVSGEPISRALEGLTVYREPTFYLFATILLVVIFISEEWVRRRVRILRIPLRHLAALVAVPWALVAGVWITFERSWSADDLRGVVMTLLWPLITCAVVVALRRGSPPRVLTRS
jgi:hypothetical protein